MDILQRDRMLTNIFPSDLAIIINLYIAQDNISHCDENIDFYVKYKNKICCKLYTDDLKKRLSKFDNFPELQNLTKHINIVDYDSSKINECIITHIGIKTCNLMLARYEYGFYYDRCVLYYFACGDEEDNFNVIDDVIDIIYSELHFQNVSPSMFCEYITCILI